MIILTRQDKTGANHRHNNEYAGVLQVLLCLLFVLSSPLLLAQTGEQGEQAGQQALLVEQVAAEEIEAVTVSLPDSQQMAMALVTPGLRENALLNLAAAAHIVSRTEAGLTAGTEVDQIALAQSFIDDRAWLQTLVDRYGWVQPHSSILDPAAWLLFDEIQPYDLQKAPLLLPGHMPEEALFHQVFQRAGLSLALVNLPNLLLEVEADVFTRWGAFLHLTEVEGAPDAAWKTVETTWFTDFQAPPVADDTASVSLPATVVNIPQAMSDIVLSAVEARPPDSKGLMRLRYSILNELSALTGDENIRARNRAKDSLYLVSLIDGLHEGRYFEFVQGLLAVTFRQLEPPETQQEAFSLVDWLVSELPGISAHYARDFASVDPHLNAALTATYDVLVTIAGFPAIESAGETSDGEIAADGSAADESTGEPDAYAADIRASRLVLADAVAQMALLVPDMAYYFDMPVRAKIATETNDCISKATSVDENGASTLTRREFDTCMEELLQLADGETRVTELSGDINGPFTADTLRRELNVAPWQRINYAIGYLDERFTTDCLPPANVLPNPLEWSVLANIMSWLAENSPEYFETRENENRIAKMRNIGEEITQAMAEQTECLAAFGTGFNDLISRTMIDYEIALRELDSGIRNAEKDFRDQRLKPGADVALDQDASQNTAYRPDDFVIAPCDAREVCEMSGNLSVTRALIGLFPNEYLVAEQTGMGHIEICYRNMEWVQRRSELVRADDENVANYFGHLGFDLVGRFVENDETTDIFGFRFTSPEENHYLFAQASDEVLNDSCPVEWVGSRMVTPLREDRGGIVPNRLTYLAASRKLPSRLLQSNWDRGAEWRDWFVTGIGVTPLELPVAAEIMTRLNQHLQALYQAEQTEIYQRILLPNYRNPKGNDVSLYDEMSEVSTAKALLRMQMLLFYPESLYNEDSILMAIAGDAGLLEQRTIRRFREDNMPLTSVSRIARERVNSFREVWSKQPEAVRRHGSLPVSLVYALTRINFLYRQFFIAKPAKLLEIETTPEQPLAPNQVP
ncbi:MAG TPA: hypothetical protein VIS57_03200 [Xanthomonadales bacterium]